MQVGNATDIIISHFHGDHTPLVDANPYQLNIKKVDGLNPNVRIWTKDALHLSPVEKKRAKSLSLILKKDFISGEGKKQGGVTFSKDRVERAWYNGTKLSQKVDTLILDHHW